MEGKPCVLDLRDGEAIWRPNVIGRRGDVNVEPGILRGTRDGKPMGQKEISLVHYIEQLGLSIARPNIHRRRFSLLQAL